MAYKTKFIPKNKNKYRGNHENISCRSLWERKFCKYLDENKNIIGWAFEPLKIPYISPIDNQMHFYIPDFLVEKRSSDGTVETLMIEIKPEKQTKMPEKGKKSKKTLLSESLTYAVNSEKWKSAEIFCNSHNIVFKILTERDLF